MDTTILRNFNNIRVIIIWLHPFFPKSSNLSALYSKYLSKPKIKEPNLDKLTLFPITARGTQPKNTAKTAIFAIQNLEKAQI